MGAEQEGDECLGGDGGIQYLSSWLRCMHVGK